MRLENEGLQIYSDAVFWSAVVPAADQNAKSSKANGIILTLHQGKEEIQ